MVYDAQSGKHSPGLFEVGRLSGLLFCLSDMRPVPFPRSPRTCDSSGTDHERKHAAHQSSRVLSLFSLGSVHRFYRKSRWPRPVIPAQPRPDCPPRFQGVRGKSAHFPRFQHRAHDGPRDVFFSGAARHHLGTRPDRDAQFHPSPASCSADRRETISGKGVE